MVTVALIFTSDKYFFSEGSCSHWFFFFGYSSCRSDSFWNCGDIDQVYIYIYLSVCVCVCVQGIDKYPSSTKRGTLDCPAQTHSRQEGFVFLIATVHHRFMSMPPLICLSVWSIDHIDKRKRSMQLSCLSFLVLSPCSPGMPLFWSLKNNTKTVIDSSLIIHVCDKWICLFFSSLFKSKFDKRGKESEKQMLVNRYISPSLSLPLAVALVEYVTLSVFMGVE